MAVFGALFALCGLAANLVVGIFMAIYGIGFVALGLDIAVARVTCDRTGLDYRKLFRSRRVLANEVTAVTVKSVPGGGYRRVRINIECHRQRPVKLVRLQRRDTPHNFVQSEADAQAIRQALGLKLPPEADCR
jgi:hypothetical protein